MFDGIRECACVGVDDPDGVTGRAPVLLSVPELVYKETGLSKYLTTRLERYKLPKRFITLETLPRSRMQKTDRKTLSRIWQETGDMPLINAVIHCLMERHSVRDFTDTPVHRPLLDQYGIPTTHTVIATVALDWPREPGKLLVKKLDVINWVE